MKQWKKITVFLLIIFLTGPALLTPAGVSAEEKTEDTTSENAIPDVTVSSPEPDTVDENIKDGSSSEETIDTEEETAKADEPSESEVPEPAEKTAVPAAPGNSLQRISDMFPDPRLADSIAVELGADTDDFIYGELEERLHAMTYLWCDYEGIESLEGVQHLTDLEMLSADGNDISDLFPLQGLTKLRALYLSSNKISDITPLRELSNLENLNLRWNHITDLSALGSGHPNLEDINAYGQTYTHKTTDLNGNDNLPATNIVYGPDGSRIQPSADPGIAYDTQTGALTFLNIRTAEGTLAYCFSLNTGTLEFSGSVIQPYQNGNSASFDGTFPARLNEIFESESLAENIGHELALEDVWNWHQRDHWTSTAVTESELGKVREIVQNQYVGMEDTAPVDSLEGLQYCKNMVSFWLDPDLEHNLTDLSPLSGLNELRYLSLPNSNIADINYLRNLKNLEVLDLDQNNISDISTLANLPQLKDLNLDNNHISDISPLGSLENLYSYYVYGQKLSIETAWNPSDASIQMSLPVTGLDGTASDIAVTSITPTGTYYADKQLLQITGIKTDTKAGFTFKGCLSGEWDSGFSGTVDFTVTSVNTIRRLVSSEGIIVEGVIPEGAEFITRKISSGTEYDLLKNHMSSLHPEYTVYQMYLTKGGKVIQPGSTVKISIPVSQKQQHTGAYRLESDHKINVLTSSSSDDYITFETEHFSYYGIGTGKIAAASAKSGSNQSVASNPQTGDSAHPFTFLLLLLIAIVIMGVLFKSKRRKNCISS